MVLRTEQEKRVYDGLLALYDYAEKLLDVLEENLADPDEGLDLIEPLIEQLETSADTPTEAYQNFVRTGLEPSDTQKEQIEAAITHIYTAIDACKKRILQ